MHESCIKYIDYKNGHNSGANILSHSRAGPAPTPARRCERIKRCERISAQQGDASEWVTLITKKKFTWMGAQCTSRRCQWMNEQLEYASE